MSFKTRPKLLTRLMPSMRLVTGVEYPFLYDLHSDSIFMSKNAKHKGYTSVRALCESTMHNNRLNNFSTGLSTVDYRMAIREVEINLAVFLLSFYMGGYGINRLTVFKYIHEVIESWTEGYTKKTNAKIKVDWNNVMNMATFYIPNKDMSTFYKKIRSPKKVLIRRHLE